MSRQIALEEAFSPALVPRDKLMPSERRDLLAMLTKVANTFGEASELQRHAIARLGHLLAVLPALARVARAGVIAASIFVPDALARPTDISRRVRRVELPSRCSRA